LSFIDPYGMVCLCQFCRHLGNRFKYAGIVLPDRLDVQAYMARMGFFGHVGGHVSLHNQQVTSDGGRLPASSEVLLELTSVKRQEDVVEVTRVILDRMKVILREQLHYSNGDINKFATVLGEVCHNIHDHSEDEGVVCVQRYTSRDGRKYVVIGVADLGIGIRASLAKRFPDANGWPHHVAIASALRKDFSRYPDRGLGLYIISQIVGQYRGSLDIRSGDTRLSVKQRAGWVQSCPFPGTQVSIRLSQKG
jgi:anti-sigma regulatory factor (Ser/Thr protein kinase)